VRAVERQYLTKQQYVCATLRDAIIRCDLAPGERLVIDDLARRMDVSIIPVREALRLLESEGLVVSVAHVGTTVAPVSRASVLEVFAILEGLESASACAAAKSVTAADLAELEDLVAAMDRDIEAERHDLWAELNTRFHLAISRASRMPMLDQMLRRALDHWDRVRRYFFRGVLVPRVATAQHEHRDMVAHIKSGDIAALEGTVRAHNRGAREAYLAYLDAEPAVGLSLVPRA
jgi:DNA-binding GntR family transcriptional regulator